MKRTAVRAASPDHRLPAERGIAWLVLFAIAMSIVSHAIGYHEVDGEPKNGIRRAASQLERKVAKGNAMRDLRPVQIWSHRK